jgi:cytochrome P450
MIERDAITPKWHELRSTMIAHVGFCSGQHVWIGSRLSEMQLSVALAVLADRVPGRNVLRSPQRWWLTFFSELTTFSIMSHPR